jgi:hypothetical protein
MGRTTPESNERRFNRRGFLGRVGTTAAGVAIVGRGGLGAAGSAQARVASASAAGSPSSFTRLFPALPTFASQSKNLEAALVDIAKPGGILDAKDALERGPVDLITDPTLSANNRNNPTHTAGTTFMGQFLDHDMTFDVASRLGQPTEPADATNGRTPSFDLDSVYGGGPIRSPQLYDPSDLAKLRIESGGIFEDLPRMADGTALVADPRNDENLIITGLQCAFILFHNHAVDLVRSEGSSDAFADARRLTTWHYHWLILHEFLPLFVGQAMVDDVLRRRRRLYDPALGQASIPVEFQGACYRFGHSMVRPSYRANLKGDNGSAFFGMIFDPAGEGQSDPVDLRGGARAPRRFIGWQTFFDFGDNEVKPNKRIDTKLSTPLFNLPLFAIASHDPPVVLPQRTLLRHLTWKLPSGQRIAEQLGVTPLAREDFAELAPYDLKLDRSTPLFYYTLKEAELVEDGLHLGPVGGRIVAEVFIGLLQSDPGSYLNVQPDWQPTLPKVGSSFQMTDFLRGGGSGKPACRAAGVRLGAAAIRPRRLRAAARRPHRPAQRQASRPLARASSRICRAASRRP